MFKKSLIAVAVLGATAFSVQAADVTMYGKVDTGLQFKTNEVTKGNQTVTDTDTFSMENGLNSASRFGIKGSEDLGNGMKVSFQLENGFKSDSGVFKTDGKLFDRQATVALSSDFGTLTMGRVGGIGSGAGFDLVYGYGDAFDGGSPNVLGLAKSDRYDNMVTYQTPKFAGLQATVQYSFNEDSTDKGREGSSAVNRYASAGLTGNFGALNTVLAYEFQNYQSVADGARSEDGHIVYLGGNYDCGFAKTFVMGQYFKGLKVGSVTGLGMLGDIKGDQPNTTLEDDFDADYNKGAKGYGLHLGTIVPISNGDLTVGAYYVDGTAETSKTGVEERDFDYMGLATKYEYRLSKRTSVYLGAGFYKATVDATSGQNNEIEQKVGEVYTGLTHAF
nr:porin [uncultured Sutterella sp.]